MLHPQPPQPTYSHASTLANTVRIEKLSDDEDEDVDITDDLSDDEEAEGKPQTVLKTEVCGQEVETEMQADQFTEEQEDLSEAESNCQIKDLPSHSSLPVLSPQVSSSLACPGVDALDEDINRTVSTLPENIQTQNQDDTNKDQSSQCEVAAQTGQHEEAYPNEKGNLTFCKPSSGSHRCFSHIPLLTFVP